MDQEDSNVNWREWRRGALLIFKCAYCDHEVTVIPEDLIAGELLDVSCVCGGDMLFSHVLVAAR